MKILMIDDDRKLCRLVTDYLEPMGYEVEAAHNGAQGLEMVKAETYHAAILDVMLPEMDGFEVLKLLRKESDIPVLMLSARGDETDRIVGLEMGADDYLPKTFSSRELLARLRAVTRRCQRVKDKPGPSTASDAADDVLIFAELRIDQGSRTVRLNEETLTLTPLEYDLLVTLAHSAGRVLNRDQLLDAVAGRNYEVFDRSVDVHISSLRKKLGENPRNPRFIRTIRTAGYMFHRPDKEE
ncbi:response regulator transcription factor [Candidatus Electrothrix sp.]|uniref:response regulator transcription factor n=1 Tax=Candidatus Electrothrix sp. TaxID=2170559 RepID=UPI0040577528